MRVCEALRKYLSALRPMTFHAPGPTQFDEDGYPPGPRPVPGIPWEDRFHPDTVEARGRAYDAYARVVNEDARMHGTIPHCDARILHDPHICSYCDRPALQGSRKDYGIALSGQAPTPDRPYPCPADDAVHRGERGDYNRWHGNVPHLDVMPYPGEPTMDLLEHPDSD